MCDNASVKVELMYADAGDNMHKGMTHLRERRCAVCKPR